MTGDNGDLVELNLSLDQSGPDSHTTLTVTVTVTVPDGRRLLVGELAA